MQLGPNLVVANRFRLNQLLGRGGMGSVWHATHLGLDTPCAVKFIEGEGATHPEAQARFEREAKAAAALRSPHVVQIFDHGVWDGIPYIAMELLDGEDLGKRMTRLGRLAPKEILAVVTQVCRALTKAHSQGIVHRDLKPDNIFLVRDDDREIAKVLDFGIAKKQSALDGASTKTGAMLGTPYYMSPEQAQGTKAVDARSDLWSLAVIVFQALTGRLPFESEALGDLLVKIIVSPVPLPSQFVSDLPPAFEQWWQRAASRDPGQRFQTAKELAESLALVFGVSQITELVERAPLRSVTNEQQVAPHTQVLPGAPAPVPTPAGHQPPAMRPSLPSGMSTPSHLQGAPVPPVPVVSNTGGPFAHTFSGSGAHPAPTNKRTTMFVALGALGLLILFGAGFGIALALRSRPTNVAAAGGAASVVPTQDAGIAPEGATAAPPATVAEPTTAATVTPQPPTQDATPAPQDTPPATTPAKHTTAPSVPVTKPATNAGTKTGGTTKPASTGKKGGGDLGF
jgi:serine/threonine-protein kinase